MIAQVDGPDELNQESRQISRTCTRIDRLSQAEVAYIGNEQFTPTGSFDGDLLHPLLDAVERGEIFSSTKGTAGLSSHLARLCDTPLLSPEEEQLLFRRMNFCKYRANCLRARISRKPDIADEMEGYLAKAELIRNYLVQANTRLVMSIARKFADARNQFDDLLSQGIASLMHAVEKFDFSRGYRFSTYATCAVRRDLYRMVMGRKKDLQRFSTGSSEYLDGCPDEKEHLKSNAEAEWNSLTRGINKILDDLDDRERYIMINRYGLNKSNSLNIDKKKSYSQLGKALGISKERVRQLANRAMEKLRKRAVDLNLELLLS